jgi:hypothetical protein
MKRLLGPIMLVVLIWTGECCAGFFDDIKEMVLPPPGGGGESLDNVTIVKGLKEALASGTERAVKAVGKQDGYFGNEAIKILMPEKIQNVANLLGRFGFHEEVDAFILSMNRAAEQAAPKAAGYFADAVREMSIDDAQGILKGGDTAATEFFRKKTGDKLYQEFKPVIAKKMGEVGVTSAYKDMMGKYATLPLMGKETLDLDHYVTNKSLDGLFTMLGEEERKIRQNPAARTSEILKKVFGK